MNIAHNVVKIVNKVVNIAIYIVLILGLLLCAYAIYDNCKVYFKASNSNILDLKPNLNNPVESFAALKKINEDVCGWITIDDTNIDYPIVRGKNNSEYINKDVFGNYSLSGCIFLDYRNSVNFSDYYSLIYGHHMSGGAMFGDITKYVDEEFFKNRKTGTLYTEKSVYDLEVIAYLSTDAYDNSIYSLNKNNEEDRTEFIKYIENNAENLSASKLNTNDKIITLSTCSVANTNGRDILVLRILEK